MVEQARQLVDLDDDHLSKVRFGRNRFLRALGVGLFGLATGMVVSREAQAQHRYAVAPCRYAQMCHKCSGARCTAASCSPRGGRRGNPNLQCWRGSTWAGYGSCRDIWRCCDWKTTYFAGHPTCICRGYVGRVC